MSYAEGTAVTPERSQMEIAALIRKYGASSFITGFDGDRALVEFIANDRRIRFVLDLPTDPKKFGTTPTGRAARDPHSKMEDEVKRRWRALALVIKAKLEVVATGISTFETEFMAQTVMPDGRTVAEHVMPRIDEAYATGQITRGGLLAIEASS